MGSQRSRLVPVDCSSHSSEVGVAGKVSLTVSSVFLSFSRAVSSGRVFAMGDNSEGQLGLGDNAQRCLFGSRTLQNQNWIADRHLFLLEGLCPHKWWQNAARVVPWHFAGRLQELSWAGEETCMEGRGVESDPNDLLILFWFGVLFPTNGQKATALFLPVIFLAATCHLFVS